MCMWVQLKMKSLCLELKQVSRSWTMWHVLGGSPSQAFLSCVWHFSFFSAPPHGSEPRCPHAKTPDNAWLWWSGWTVSKKKKMRNLNLVTPGHFSYFSFIYTPPPITQKDPLPEATSALVWIWPEEECSKMVFFFSSKKGTIKVFIKWN